MIKKVSLIALMCVFSQVVSADIIYSPSESNGWVHSSSWQGAFVNLDEASLCTLTTYGSGGTFLERDWGVIEFPIDAYNNTNIQNASLNFYFHNSSQFYGSFNILGFNVKVLTGQSGDGIVDVDDIGNLSIFSKPNGFSYDDEWFTIDVKDILQDAVNQSHNWMMFSIHINGIAIADMEYGDYTRAHIALSEDTSGKAPYLSIMIDIEPPTPDPMTWAMVPTPGRFVSIITDMQENLSQTYFAGNVSNTDLIEGATPSSSLGPWGNNGNATDPNILTNGINGDADELAQAVWDVVDNDGSFVEYTLGTGDNGLGYDITSIRTFSACKWADLHEQHYKVFLKKVGQAFAELTEVNFQPTIGDGGATQVTLTGDIGIVASGVEAIWFDFNEITSVSPASSTAGTLYREIDVQGVSTSVGSPPPVNTDTSISMTASTATDISGVEYYFAETSGNTGGDDSDWQDSPVYVDTGLSPNTTYTYKVMARDKGPAHNSTDWSASESVTTDRTCSTCGDIDGSGGNVDLADFAKLAGCWGKYPSTNTDCICANLVEDSDDIIDLLDLAVFAELFISSSLAYPPNCLVP